jgi:UDP-N-acetylglucosamine 2-epimerase (non-hydrolysing)
MRSMHILHVVGARPNFMKAAPVLRALSECEVRQTLVHTGQHYDAAMSDVFFRQLEMPAPDVNLGVGSGSHAQQTAAVMAAFEPVLLERKPDLVLVYGDVNSTLAAALVCSKLACKKLPVRVGHVEAGLRSGDRSMPEEINRLITDQLSALLFTPSADADENLLREGIDAARIHRVGNVMIDTLVRMLPLTEKATGDSALANPAQPYALVTLHRPSNVDDLPWLRELLATLTDLSSQMQVIFPVHPRTRQRLNDLLINDLGALLTADSRLHFTEPLPYLEFLALERHAAMVITDSGGIQEETSFLSVPCLTVRENTERPITVKMGSNQLVGRDLKKLRVAAEDLIRREPNARDAQDHKKTEIPLWDGQAAERIAQVIVRAFDAENPAAK